MAVEIPDEGLDAWLSELKTYQRKHLDVLLRSMAPEDAAEAWLSVNGPSYTSGFGAPADTKPLFNRLKSEFKKFVCGHPDYEEERKQLGGERPITKSVLIYVIGTAVAAKLGVLMALIVPAVVILLFVVGKAGRNAWCADFQVDDPE